MDLLLQLHADVSPLDLGVNTTTPEIVGESERLITLNSFSKITSVATTDIAGIAKLVCIHNADFYDKMLAHTAFISPSDIFSCILIHLLLRNVYSLLHFNFLRLKFIRKSGMKELKLLKILKCILDENTELMLPVTTLYLKSCILRSSHIFSSFLS